MKKIVGIFFIMILMCIFSSPTSAFEFKNMERVDIHGFFSQGYLQSSDNNFLTKSEEGSFEFNEMAINFSTNIADNIQLGIQFFARDLGDLGNDEIVLDWVFADYRWEDWLGIVMGKIKLPKGLYNEIKDIDMLRTYIFLPQSVYKIAWRDTLTATKGIGAYGQVMIGPLGSIDYQLQAGIVNIEQDSGIAKSIESVLPPGVLKISNFDVDSIKSGSLIWNTPLSGLRLGGSLVELIYTANGIIGGETLASLDDTITVPVYSFEYTFKSLILSAEYIEMKREMVQKIESTVLPEDTTTSQGGYVSLSFRLASFLELGIYYSEYYTDKDDKDGKKFADESGLPDHTVWSIDFAQSVRFDINDNWILKLEHHLMDGTDIMYPQDQDDYTVSEQKYSLYAAKVTFSF